jgi:ParB family chromosome partitioning protein
VPELKRVPLTDIDEPDLPIREAMDEKALADLAHSMATTGLLQPILVKAKGDRYEIECGHRRFMAAMSLHWSDIPAIIHQPGEIVEGAAMLAENLYREDITAAEEAFYIVQLQEKFSFNEAQLCAALKHSPDWIADRLRLLGGDEQVLNAVRARKINFSVARELNKCPDADMRRYFLDAAMRSESGARVVAGWVAEHKARPPADAVQSSDPKPLAPSEPAPAPFFGCELCGGDRDPYNLVNVQVHKWEWERIKKAYLSGPVEVEA